MAGIERRRAKEVLHGTQTTDDNFSPVRDPTTRFIQFGVQYASIVLVFYDYALTWTREVKYFWHKKFTISTALYIACRYSMIANILYLVALADRLPRNLRDSGPKALGSSDDFLKLQWRISRVLGARTYATFNRSKYILFGFGFLGITIVIMDSFHVRWLVCVNVAGPDQKTAEPFAFSVLFSLLVVFYEILAAALTMFRGLQALRIRIDLKTLEKRLDYLVVKEGTLYFAFLSLFGLASLLMLTLAPSGSFIQRLLNALTLPVSGLMIARFLIHLREWEHKMTHMSSNHRTIEPLDFGPRPATEEFDGEEEVSTSSIPTPGIDEFGQCPITEAKRHMQTIQEEELELGISGESIAVTVSQRQEPELS
ncbi:hypothetical protein D9613_008785 [Agrocybe pediades]|uniref:DUF6533 domain-containing protein n=1 Tax=Agrocybe pediades TaxID=84607 RepID=A0A8H4QSY2_9AGAR|nr:hypothetical protein D9613_008785 [Agrocybe pediades]